MSWKQDKIKRYKKAAVTASVLTAVILFVIKTIAALMTGSIAVLSSLVDSLADIFSSLISYIAVKFSIKPASCTHRYGYLKAEALSALVQAAFVAGSGLFVFYSGIERLINPEPLKQTGVGILVMVLSLMLSILLILFQKFVIKHTDSMAVKADSAHYTVDILTNTATLCSLLVVQWLKIELTDVVTAFFIALYLIYYAFDIAKQAVSYLMDKELSTEIRKNVAEIIKHTHHIKGFHDLRTRDLGGVYYFEFHLEMDGNLMLSEAHHLSDLIEKKIKARYPKAQVLIHQEPFGLKEKRLDDTLKDCNI